MKPLILALLLLLVPAIAPAQTPIVEKNIKDCFKKSSKTTQSYDRCVAEEFRRAREEKNYRDARVKAGKDPYGGCGKKDAHRECFDEIMSDLRRTTDRLYDGSGSVSYPYVPRSPSYYYRYRLPYRYYYPRPYLFTYPRRIFRPTYRRW